MILKFLFTAAKIAVRPLITPSSINRNFNLLELVSQPNVKHFSSVLSQNVLTPKLLVDPKVTQISNNILTRNLIKFSMRKGKRKSVKAVLKRFYRLHWGIWIRGMCGRDKRLWRKSPPRKRRLRQHVFCNATQSRMLDKMAGAYWMRPRYYVEDPYEPYQIREEFHLSSIKPRPYFPPDTEQKSC